MVKDSFEIVGTTLADAFYIEEAIAEGGFGVVYRAEHAKFRAKVALKCLKIPSNMDSEREDSFIERFREEAEILFHLSAAIPEVVRPLHVDTFRRENGTIVPFMAMEWVEGDPLDTILVTREFDGKPMPTLLEAIEMLDPIAHALARAHHFQVPGGAIVSVTHCDLKPENIIITPAGGAVRAKILDYGIAKARELALQCAGRISSGEGTNPFTPSYGAPEQWVPKRYGQSGPWTDVWGLALTMVECLCGHPPIDGDMHAMMGTALDINRRPTPRSEGVDVSDEVEVVFNKAMRVDPRERYDDVEAFWTALQLATGLPSSFASRPAPKLELAIGASGIPPSDRPISSQPTLQAAEASLSSVPEVTAGGRKHVKFDLDVDVAMQPPKSTRLAKPPSPDDPAAPSRSPASRRETQALSGQLRLPLQLFAVAVACTIIDALASRFTGSGIALGPLRFRWIAAFFAGAAVLVVFLSFIRDDSDDA